MFWSIIRGAFSKEFGLFSHKNCRYANKLIGFRNKNQFKTHDSTGIGVRVLTIDTCILSQVTDKFGYIIFTEGAGHMFELHVFNFE